MKMIAFLIGLFTAASGALGIISPDRILPLARKFESRAGLGIASALQVGFGSLLLFSAIASHIPRLVRILGAGTLVSGLTLPLLGVKRFGRIIEWWAEKSSVFKRIWLMFDLGFGLLTAWALAPRR